MTTKAGIIGAGISGLVAARKLAEYSVEVCVLEARNRLGGRAFSATMNGGRLDLGPAWVWPGMQPGIRQLIKSLGLKTLPQYETGELLFESSNGVSCRQYPRRYADALRLKEGVQGLAEQLASELPRNAVRLSSEVTGIEFGARVQLHIANKSTLHADYVINTAPGPVAAQLKFQPGLPGDLMRVLTRRPTWMAAHAKVLLVYDRPFWRELGLSGSCISHVGPLSEIADQSDEERNLFALFGFVGWSADQRMANASTIQTSVEQQIIRLFGPDVPVPTSFHYQDWATEAFTATAADRRRPRDAGGHPGYGDPLFEQSWFDGKLFLAGAETSTRNGGLIEGAVESGMRAAEQVLEQMP